MSLNILPRLYDRKAERLTAIVCYLHVCTDMEVFTYLV